MKRLTPLALIPLLLAAPALAQDDPYAACAAMADNAARLACFDTTYAAQTTVRAGQVEERRVEEFGLAPSEIAEARADTREERRDQPQPPEEPEFTLVATISEAFVDGLGKHVLLLDNGQLWRETAGSSLRTLPRAGWQANIVQSWSGAYQMRFEGRRGFLRVERIR